MMMVFDAAGLAVRKTKNWKKQEGKY